MDKRGNGLKTPLWKREAGEFLEEEVEEEEDEEEDLSEEEDSDEAEKASEKEGEYWESGQELQDGDGKDKGSVSYCPLRQESSTQVAALRRSESGFWTWLSPLTLFSNLAFPVDRKRIQPGEVCLLEKHRSRGSSSCTRCEILFCRKCETLHCDPNYVEHCILDHWEGGVPNQEEEFERAQISTSQETILYINSPLTMEDFQ